MFNDANLPYDFFGDLRSDPVRGQRPARSEGNRERSDRGDVLLKQPLLVFLRGSALMQGGLTLKVF